MEKKITIRLISLIFSFCVIYSCSPKPYISETTLPQNQILNESVPTIDEQFNNESEVEAYSEINSTTFDSILGQARELCAYGYFTAADSLLRGLLTEIDLKLSEETANNLFTADEYLNEIASIYTDLMPSTIQTPDQIGVLVFQRQIQRSLDSIKITAQDSTMLAKLSCQKGISYDVPVAWNARVQRSLIFLVSNKKGMFEKWLTRSKYYVPFMRRMFAENNLPQDLAYLPLIESGFNSVAYSRAKACGIWQFISSTGKTYGLRHNYWLDERRDPVKSTRAAIGYLSKLYRDFNNWHLALAAYNCGENGLARAINRCGTSDYWSLTLANETMTYVPQFIAAVMIAKNPECFGYSSEPTDTFNLDTVIVNDCIEMKEIANGINLELDSLRRLNPHILHWCTPPDMSNVVLYLPKDYIDPFHTFYNNLPEEKKVRMYVYNARKGDRIASIARKFRLTADELRSINNIRGNRLSRNSRLIIPIPLNQSTPTELAQADSLDLQIVENDQPTKKSRYKVRKGDTLWKIANRFKISTQKLCRENALSVNSRLIPGQILHINRTIPQEKNVSPKAEPTITTSSKSYTVAVGDTPYSICKRNNMTLQDFIALNNLDQENPVIQIGQTIKVTDSIGNDKSEKPEVKSPKTLRYVVSQGDNLYRIAQNFSITVGTLRELNNLPSDAIIQPGDTLLVPQGKRELSSRMRSFSSSILYYEVKQGDNLWRIAENFGVPVEDLYRTNSLKSDSVLMPGDTIKVVR